MSDTYLSTVPVSGSCRFSASDLEGKKLKWKFPSPLEVSEAPSSTMYADAVEDGTVRVAIRDSLPGENRDSDGNPVMIDVLGVWLTPEGLALLEPCQDGGADFQAIV